MVVSVAAVSGEAVVPGAEVGSWVLQVAVFPLVVPVAGDISLMPGTGSRPGFRNIDVDVETGQVSGLF